MKQNQLLKQSFARIVAFKTRISDDFRELHEKEPKMHMATLEVETKWLVKSVSRPDDFREIIKFFLFQAFSEVYWLADG